MVGEALLTHASNPLPHYFLENLRVPRSLREKGWGSKLLSGIEGFLIEKRKAGILGDGIDPRSRAKGMYERHGWLPIRVKGHATEMAFNLPHELTPDDVSRLSQRHWERSIQEVKRATEYLNKE